MLKRLVIALAAALLVVVAMSAEKPPIDPQSQAVLDKMAAFMSAAKAFTVKADVCLEEVLPSGVKVQRCQESRINVQRPDGLQVTTGGTLADRKFFYDGKTAALFFPARNQYVTSETPATLDETLDWMVTKAELSMPLLDYLHSDPLPGLLEEVRLTHYLGTGEVLGVKCHHLAFKQSTINWQLWVENSETPVPRKIVVEYKLDPGAPEYMAVLTDWQFPASLPAETFAFTPPEGACRLQVVTTGTEVQ